MQFRLLYFLGEVGKRQFSISLLTCVLCPVLYNTSILSVPPLQTEEKKVVEHYLAKGS